MIVRDEAAVIERCLRSVRPAIDRWVIVDTGSTDDTPQRIAQSLAGVPGTLHHRPWRNFGHNRSEALELARAEGDYLLFIDADEQLEVGAAFDAKTLHEPAYSLVTHFGDLIYDRVALVSSRLPWRWRGVLHEYLDAGESVRQPRVDGLAIHVTPDGARSRDPKKFEKDAAVLEAALREEPDNSRYTFYLAQSLRDAGELARALTVYQRRATQDGWEEEVWYALLQVARLQQALAAPSEQVLAAYLRAYENRPTRAEALVSLAGHLRQREQWPLAYLFAHAALELPLPSDRLFVERDAYTWRRQDECALAAFYTGRRAEAQDLWKALLAGNALPISERERVTRNLQFT